MYSGAPAAGAAFCFPTATSIPAILPLRGAAPTARLLSAIMSTSSTVRKPPHAIIIGLK